MKRFVLAASLLIAACAEQQAADAPGVARVEQGALQGVAANDVIAFKGVPFAAPPVGDLRWKPPQPAAAWEGARDAASYGAICPQKFPTDDNGVGKQTPAEDCLTLNVWTQTLDRDAKARPVMVWIHGGGFVNGSGTADLYDGTQLAKRGVVVVTLNYRLGRLGSFAHPLLTAEAGSDPVANYGLMDMIAALEWVKANISAFGGDPSNVTIFGESAGGMAVHRLMVSPKARGLFHKAVSQSGAGRERVLHLSEPSPDGLPSAEADGKAFIASLGLTPASAADLRAIPLETIIAAGDPNTLNGGGPIIEPQIFPHGIVDAFRRGLQAPVPYLTGSNSAEWPASVDEIDARLSTFRMSPEETAALAATYPDRETFAAVSVGDVVFTEPARYLAMLHTQAGNPTYLYRFSVLSESVRGRLKGLPHAQERQYVFDTLSTSPWPTDANDSTQAQFAGAYWTNFAKTGDPNGDSLPAWPTYAPTTDQLLDFTTDGPVAGPVPDAPRMNMLGARYGN